MTFKQKYVVVNNSKSEEITDISINPVNGILSIVMLKQAFSDAHSLRFKSMVTDTTRLVL